MLFIFCKKQKMKNNNTSQNFEYMVTLSENTTFSAVTNVTDRYMAFIFKPERTSIFEGYGLLAYVTQFFIPPENKLNSCRHWELQPIET